MYTIFSSLRSIYLFSVFAIAITLPFSFDRSSYNNLFIIILAISWTLLVLNSSVRGSIKTRWILIFAFLYLICVVGLIHTDNYAQAFRDLEKKLPLVLFPLFLGIGPMLESKEVWWVLRSFAISCTAVSGFCLVVAFYGFAENPDAELLIHHELSKVAGMHASYFAMHICFALVCFLHTLGKLEVRKWPTIAAIGVLLFTIFLLSARTHLIFILIYVVSFFGFQFYKSNGLIKSVIYSIIIGLATMSSILAFPSNRERFKQAINYNNQYSLDRTWGENQIRIPIWMCSIHIIEENVILGLGTGDSQDALDRCYIEREFSSLTYFEGAVFNAHNQYLQNTLEFGIFGLFAILFVFISIVRRSVLDGKFLCVVLVILFAFSCLTESMIERQKGVVFYSFFSALLFFHHPSVEKRNASLI